MIHPARRIPYSELYAALQEAKDARLVNERAQGPLRLYNYTQSCVYDRQWTLITRLARGLVLDVERCEVVATPFPKFFNIGERDEPPPDLPFEVHEKHDGSLIIAFHDGKDWLFATRGSFNSEQAISAAKWAWNEPNLDRGCMKKGFTYLFEYVGPANKIVVPYEREELILLGVYDQEGHEQSSELNQTTAEDIGVRMAAIHAFDDLQDLVAHASILHTPKKASWYATQTARA